MVDLQKLDDMLTSALEAETAETLNQWIQDCIDADLREGFIRDAGLGILNLYNRNSTTSTLNSNLIESGIAEFISYDKVEISDSFDVSKLDNLTPAA